MVRQLFISLVGLIVMLNFRVECGSSNSTLKLKTLKTSFNHSNPSSKSSSSDSKKSMKSRKMNTTKTEHIFR